VNIRTTELIKERMHMLYMYIDEGFDRLYRSNFIDKSNENVTSSCLW